MSCCNTTMTMPITFVSDCSTETSTEAKERGHSRKHEQATCVPITFIDGANDQFNKKNKNSQIENTLEKCVKTFKRIDLTASKQGYTLERHPTKIQKELNYDTDDTNCGKTGESFVFKESKSKSFKELIKSLTPACDSSESDDDFDKAFQPLIIDSNMFFVTLGELTESGKQVMQVKSYISD